MFLNKVIIIIHCIDESISLKPLELSSSSTKIKRNNANYKQNSVVFELLAESSEAAAAEAKETPQQLCRANCRLAMGHDPYKLSGALQNTVQGTGREMWGETRTERTFGDFPKVSTAASSVGPSITLTDCHTFYCV